MFRILFKVLLKKYFYFYFSIIPSVPKQLRNTYNITLIPSNPTYTSWSVPVHYYIQPNKTIYASDF